MLRLSPLPAAGDSAFYSPVWIDGRRYLRNDDGGAGYIPICQAFGAVVFPDLRGLQTLLDGGGGGEVEALLRAWEQAREGYGAIKRRKGIMWTSMGALERLARCDAAVLVLLRG